LSSSACSLLCRGRRLDRRFSRLSGGDDRPPARAALLRLLFVSSAAVLMSISGMSSPLAAQTVDRGPVDIVLALDNSGSMTKHDPSGLMRTAAASFARQLPADSMLGIVVFDQSSRVALDLTAVAANEFSGRVDRALADVDYRGPLTDIPGAVERSIYEIREHGRPGVHRVILLFTDGFVDLGDVNRNQSRTAWLVSDLVPEAQREHVKVFGVAFTDQADFELIQSLSQKTGGAHFRLRDANQFGAIFVQVTARIQEITTTARPATPMTVAQSQAESAPGGPSSIWLVVSISGLCVAAAWRVWYMRSGSVDAPATLQDLADPSRIHTIERRLFRIGSTRHKGLRRNDLVIPLRTISRAQATIRGRDGKFYIADDGSTNHTFVSTGQGKAEMLAIGEARELRAGDLIRFDTKEFRFGFAAGVVHPRRPSARTEWSPPEEVEAVPRRVDTIPPAESGRRKIRVETQPPAPQTWSNEAGVVGSAGSPQEPLGCVKCDCHVSSNHLTTWLGVSVCRKCETELLEIPTSEAPAQRDALLTKQQRRRPTVPSP
jgi:pSer/pThr/pTyr-binding forkhead associated (FHA) protein/Mg-chelatase subunit ChlD